MTSSPEQYAHSSSEGAAVRRTSVGAPGEAEGAGSIEAPDPGPGAEQRMPVTAEDLERAVDLAVAVLGRVPDGRWDAKAGSLEWSCRETVEHLADDLFAYAAQLGPRRPPSDHEVPFRYVPRRPGGPANVIHAEQRAGTSGLLEVLDACAGMLIAMVRVRTVEYRAHHVFGASDPEGFAAMGVVETLVHLHDVAQGTGVPWTAPRDLCARVLDRLFPEAPRDVDAWDALLWSAGRGELPGRGRLARWRWYGDPQTVRTTRTAG